MGSLVDPPEQSSIVHDVPDPVCNLLEPDVLVAEGIAEKGLSGMQAEGSAVADAADLHVARILRRHDALWICAQRRLPERGLHPIVDSLMVAVRTVTSAAD